MPTFPLSGIRVLDFSRLLPGPYLTQLLGDLGAEIIKVETPLAGDYSRSAPPEFGFGNFFETINRGKKSVAINYRVARGKEIFLKLAGTADVILEGFRPGTANRHGIGYEAVRAVKPDIVYCSLSGYGQDGSYRYRAGHDLNYLAISGALELNSLPGQKPSLYGFTVADLSGAMLAAIAILSALVGREKNKQGMYLDMALLDGAMSWMTPLASSSFFSGMKIQAGNHPFFGGLPCYNIYETADGKYITLAALEPNFWTDFCKITGRGDLLPRQADRSTGEDIANIFLAKTRDEWLSLFAESDGCVEAVNSFEEMLIHPQIKERGYVQEENGKAVRMNSPFVFARAENTPAPKLGQHTREILHEIGISESEIEELAVKRVLGVG